MRPNKQVSLAVRILREKRDASARATHLEAANEKYLLTTNERKQMSTTTNFKRIALVAVAALGLGVLSSVPSNAAITGTVTVTATNGNATTSLADSTTAGSLKVRWLATGSTDSVSITTALNSKPSGATTRSLNFYPTDTSTSISPATLVPASRSVAAAGQDTAVVAAATSAGYVAGTFAFQLDGTPDKAGTYAFTLTITPFNGGAAESTKVQTQEVSITVTAPASSSTTAASTYSSVALVTGTSADSSTADATSISLAGKASASASATAFVKLRNAVNGAAETLDSLTVTIDKGNIGTTSTAATGKSVIINYAPISPAGGVQFYVFPDGTSGTATITVATKNAGSFTKTLTWTGSTVGSIVAASYRSVIAVGTESSKGAVKVNAYDANSNSFGSLTAVYAYSSDTTVISDYGTACTYDSTDKVAYCTLTGVKAGTANITYRDAATVALSTVASNAVAVRVSTGVVSSFTLTTDKASYAPGEKGYLIITVKDAAGLVMPTLASTSIFASGGITTNAQLGNSSDTTTGVAFATDRSTTPASTDPIKYYTFYAPAAAGTVTFSAKGASTLSAASQATATTATITVADNASAALAAVSALAVTVASLKTLITTLTNLVLKIQKKVKA
jgi:trimeric autotransporter adhesin